MSKYRVLSKIREKIYIGDKSGTFEILSTYTIVSLS